MDVLTPVIASPFESDAAAPIVADLSAMDEPAWDRFAERDPLATPFHLLGWRTVIGRTYGYVPHYLVAKQNDEITGLLPLFEVHSAFQGRHFTSLPGGILAASHASALALIEHARGLAAEHAARFLAIRDTRQRWDAGLVTDQKQCILVVDVDCDLDVMWQRLRRTTRGNVRQARRSGATVRLGVAQMDEFYRMFSEFLRSCGTPVFPRQLLTNLERAFGDRIEVIGVWNGGCMVGGTLNFHLSGTAFGLWGASLHTHLDLRPNFLLYWEAIRWACERGYHHLDLGRSEIGSGQHHFKRNWAATEYPVYQQYFLNGAKKPPIAAADTAEGSARLMVKVWQHLPLGLTRVLGPVIRRQIPFV